jgi:hypothetical protein
MVRVQISVAPQQNLAPAPSLAIRAYEPPRAYTNAYTNLLNLA